MRMNPIVTTKNKEIFCGFDVIDVITIAVYMRYIKQP